MDSVFQRSLRIFLWLLLGGGLSWAFLHFSIPRWSNFWGGPELMGIRQFGQLALFVISGFIFGVIGHIISRNDKTAQLIAAAIVPLAWLMAPFGFIEGTLLPIIPVVASTAFFVGTYAGHHLRFRAE